MAFDFKKEYREFYLPPAKPGLVEIPPMDFIAVRGRGDPNEPGGEYQRAMGLLYGVAFTIKMSKLGARPIKGYFDYVVPPLEGFWWMRDGGAMDYSRKEELCWVSLIRLPDFVSRGDFEWALGEAARKKKQDFSPVEFLPYAEGLCVQCMHIGSYDDEPATLEDMEEFAAQQGYALDITPERYHHEIYLSDPRKVPPERRRTVLRVPVRRK
ncbi:MAG: transcriptional regulator [Oscillospiraceae bacterium]|nr:transcriptional regulator [Oscillospiraceae bacterium]